MSGRSNVIVGPTASQETKTKDANPQAKNSGNSHHDKKPFNNKKAKSKTRPGSVSTDRHQTPNGVVALQKEKGFLPTDPIGSQPRTLKSGKVSQPRFPKFSNTRNEGKALTPDRPVFNGRNFHHPSSKSGNQQSPRQTGTLIDSLFKPKPTEDKPSQSADVFKQLFPNGKPNGIKQNLRQKSDHAISPPVDVPVRISHSAEAITSNWTPSQPTSDAKDSVKDKDPKKSSASLGGISQSPVTNGDEVGQNGKRKRNKRPKKKKPKDEVNNVRSSVNKNSTEQKQPIEEKKVDILGLVNKTKDLKIKDSMPEAANEAKPPQSTSETHHSVKEASTSQIKTNQTQQVVVNNQLPPAPNGNLEQLGLQQAATRLTRDYIVSLEKKSSQFPEAKFVCKLCNYHLDSVILAHRHIKEKRHRKLWKEKKQDEMLKEISLPPPQALNVLQNLLVEKVLKGAVLSADDVKLRKSVVQKLDDLISKQMTGSMVVMYGSSISGFGFKSSDINVDLQYPSSMKAPNALLRVLDILERSKGQYKDVNADFRAKIPRIEFTDVATSLSIRLSTNNEFAITTTRLLMFYAALDPRVLQLSMVFRTWAQLCKLDRQHEGSLPPYAFVLMTIFFMQKQNFLPVLHEIISPHDMDTILSMSMNCAQLVSKGDTLWYIPSPAPTCDSTDRVNSQGTEESGNESESEPDATATDGTDAADSADSRSEQTDVVSEKRQATPLKPVSLMAECGGRDEGVALLWLKMLKFFALEYNIENLIISVRHSSDVKREDRNWGKKRVAVLDPYSTKRNLCRSMNSQNVFSYMMTRLKAAVLYFHGSPRKQVKRDIIAPATMTKQSVEKCVKDLITEMIDGVESQINNTDVLTEATVSPDSPTQQKNLDAQEVEDGSAIIYEYKFTRDVITEGNNPVVVCGLCKKEGHVREKCPDEVQTHKLHALPNLTPELRDMLDRVSQSVMGLYMPSREELNQRQHICSNLTRYLQYNYNSHSTMQLFGSSKNGFGFKGSDLDICLTLDNNDNGEGLDFVSIIEDVARCLRRCGDLRGILPITTAKVPIVKFEHRSTGLEGDISLYNLLAQRNTLMLSCYANVDERCRILGYVMKAFVKRCHIGDASRGSLSSYAYTLMVIFFLQQRSPAVLPVLQQLDTDGTKEVVVDGWNSWFFDDLNDLERVWPEMGKNTETVGELWLGMIRFYTEDFDFRKHVVSIRQKKLLTTFEKEWTSKFISIEDPFDLNHNLGAGVSRKMTNFIMRVFMKARQHFGNLPKAHIPHLREVSYFFDAKTLMDGEEAPNDRCCRICGKIGHFVRTCPKSRRRKRDGDADEDGMSEVKCFYCGEMGHIKKDCQALKEDNQKVPTRRQISGESPNKMGGRPIPANRNSPMNHGPPTPARLIAPARYETGRSPSYNHLANQSPAERYGKTNKRLPLDASPSTNSRDQANKNTPRARKNSSGAATPSGQPSPSAGYRHDQINDNGKHVPSRAKSGGKWKPFPNQQQLHVTMPSPNRLSHSPSNEAQAGASHQRSIAQVSSPQSMPTLSQIESQMFGNSPREKDRKNAEHAGSEPPSPRGQFFASPGPVAVVPAAPMLGLGVRIPTPGQHANAQQNFFSPPNQGPHFPPYGNPELSPQTPPFPFYSCSPGSSPWNGQFFHRGGS
uniref:Terminal uridylyltransferase 4 n=1 Tax=Phallusia mammillata TaxID=59560 RepID=A0A6F9DVB4_9ASCI|nr:terminal uridylyltransferase 4 [Phallusia mammillata]